MGLGRAILDTQPQGQGVAGLPGPFFPPPSLTALGPLQLVALQTDPPLKRAFWWHSFACFTNSWIVFVINLLGVKDPFKKLIKAIDLFSRKCTYNVHLYVQVYLLRFTYNVRKLLIGKHFSHFTSIQFLIWGSASLSHLPATSTPGIEMK